MSPISSMNANESTDLTTEQTTPPPANPNNSTSSNNHSERAEGNRRSRNNRRRGNNNPSTSTPASVKKFEGDTPTIGAVLCLSNEDVDLGKEGFTKFQSKLEEYILREFDNAKDIAPLIINLKDPSKDFEAKHFPKSKYTTEECENDPIKKKIVESQANMYMARVRDLDQNIAHLFSRVWGQCTPALQAELKAEDEYDTKRENYDALWLMTTAKKLIASVDSRGNPFYNAMKIIDDFHKIKQYSNESPQKWLDRFQAAVDTMYLAGCGHIFYSPTVSGHTAPSTDEVVLTKERKKFEAMYFFMRSDANRYGPLQHTLFLDMVKGNDHYPQTTTAAYDMLLQYDQ